MGILRREQGEADQAKEIFQIALVRAERHRWPSLSPLLSSLGHLAMNCDDLDTAEDYLQRALHVATGSEEAIRQGEVLSILSHLQMLRGDHETALRTGTQALGLLQVPGGMEARSRTAFHMAILAMRLGRLDEAEARTWDARAAYERLGWRAELGEAETMLGEIARQRGQLPRAAAHYVAANHHLGRLRGRGQAVAQLNLALVSADMGAFTDARRWAEEALAAFEQRGRRLMATSARLILLRVAAEGADREACRRHAHHILAIPVATVDPDLAMLAHKGGRAGAQLGDEAWARPILELALSQWQALGRTAEAAATQALLDEPRSSNGTPG
jgi:tetratricopeptide (TPR) repeat protein